jgi:hypothetical protein
MFTVIAVDRIEMDVLPNGAQMAMVKAKVAFKKKMVFWRA